MGLALDPAGLPAAIGFGELHQPADHLHEMLHERHRVAGHRRSLHRHRNRQRHQVLHQRMQGRRDDARLPGTARAHQRDPLAAAQRSCQRLLAAAGAGHRVERDVGGQQLLMSGGRIERAAVVQDLQCFTGHRAPPRIRWRVLRRRRQPVQLAGPAATGALFTHFDQPLPLQLGDHLHHPRPRPAHPDEQSLVRCAGPTEGLELLGEHPCRPAQLLQRRGPRPQPRDGSEPQTPDSRVGGQFADHLEQPAGCFPRAADRGRQPGIPLVIGVVGGRLPAPSFAIGPHRAGSVDPAPEQFGCFALR